MNIWTAAVQVGCNSYRHAFATLPVTCYHHNDV